MRMRACLASILVLAICAGAAAQFPDVYYYKFDEGQGQQVINWAVPANPPSFHNGLGGNWETTGVPVGSSAMNFAGQDFLVCGGGIDTSQSYTIEMWCKTNVNNPGIGRIWGDYSIALFRCYLTFFSNGADYLGGHLGPGLQASGAVVDDTAWHHIALVYDMTNSTATTYVDGQIDQVAAGIAPGGVGTDMQLGGRIGVSPIFDGAVDEFRVWQSARSQADIMNNMNVSLTPPNITAAFTASATSGNVPLIVSFQDLSDTPDPGGITSWSWDVDGDGVVDYTTQNPCHAYGTPNTSFNVSLTVTDATSSATTTYTGYINTGNVDFALATCGQGDLLVSAPTPPANWPVAADGFTLVSSTTNAPVGSGSFFGLWFDATTFVGLLTPALPGNPLHFVNTGSTNLYPFNALSFPAGTFAPGGGLSFDAVVVYRDLNGLILQDAVTNQPLITGVARVIF